MSACKNFENRSTFEKVMDKNKMSCFVTRSVDAGGVRTTVHPVRTPG